jgi:AraC-like DNA-binding protein
MNIAIARLTHIGLVEAAPDWHLPDQVHPFHEILVITEGSLRVTIGGHETTGAAGDVLFYEAGRLHDERADPEHPPHLHFLTLEWEDARGSPVCVHDTHGRLRQLAQWLHHEWRHHGPHAERARRTFFHSMLAEWVRLTANREHPLVESVREFVRSHIDQPLTLDRLARHAGMSKFHFIRLYKRLTTRTPMKDVRAIRIGFAQNLILTTDLPLKAIAPRAGLGDQYHLSRLFRRYLNATPGEIRRSLKD